MKKSMNAAKPVDEWKPHYINSNGDMFNDILTPKYDTFLP